MVGPCHARVNGIRILCHLVALRWSDKVDCSSGCEEAVVWAEMDQGQVMYLERGNEGTLGMNKRVKGCLSQRVEFWENGVNTSEPAISFIKVPVVGSLVTSNQP